MTCQVKILMKGQEKKESQPKRVKYGRKQDKAIVPRLLYQEKPVLEKLSVSICPSRIIFGKRFQSKKLVMRLYVACLRVQKMKTTEFAEFGLFKSPFLSTDLRVSRAEKALYILHSSLESGVAF